PSPSGKEASDVRKDAGGVQGTATLSDKAVIPKHAFQPEDGIVPDEKTAIKIAVAVWEPIYGEVQIAREKPYHARLDTKGVWIVEGSLPEGWFGGVAIAEIAKDDGRILRVSHGK
ncbi:MAG TPA: YbbC/YhhH family protein, partial [Pirellulales bacterium]|nr:YbbC/YhhH family protein [Pirellulales bacterium]